MKAGPTSEELAEIKALRREVADQQRTIEMAGSGMSGHRRRTSWRIILVVLVAAGPVVAGVATASAGNIWQPHPGYTGATCNSSGQNICMADDKNHHIHLASIGSQMQTALRATINGSYNTTDVHVYEVSTCVSVTDVCFVSSNTLQPDPHLYGLTDCIARTTWDTKRCERYTVTFFQANINASGYNFTSTFASNARRHIACHELGHTFGLLHGDNANPPMSNQANVLSCLKGWASDSSFPDIGLGVHNANHLNNSSYYP